MTPEPVLRQRKPASRAQRNFQLDSVRFGAALLVLISHLRAFVLVDYALLDKPSVPLRLFYFVTGLGHEAVVVFFVLSGYFVSRTVSQPSGGQWRAADYAINRLSRLWTVLVPGLLATLLLDWLGAQLSGSSYYQGALIPLYHSGPPAPQIPLDAWTFFGNLAFLQTIAVPTYGDNVPLWSLANEFWYYALFPLLFIGIAGGRKVVVRVLALSVALALMLWLPAAIVEAFGIWLLGYAIAVIGARPQRLRWAAHASAKWSAALLVLAALMLARSHRLDQMLSDYLLGLAVAALLITLLQPTSRVADSSFGRLMELGAEMSYSLYIFHFPLLSFIACVVLGNRTYAPDAQSMLLFAALLGLVLLYGLGAYWLFERNTFQVRTSLQRLFR